LPTNPDAKPNSHRPVRRALLSVSDKTGIVDLAKALQRLSVELLSTGGTAAQLREAGISVTDVSTYTGFPEIMDGRVKTLHPRIHGGLLGRRGHDDAVMAIHGIEPIDLLVVNLYPFSTTISEKNVSYVNAIEQIDVGGPAMLRAAAKNHADVAVVVDPKDYASIIAAVTAGGTTYTQRQRLACSAFSHTAHYDTVVASWLEQQLTPNQTSYPEVLELTFVKKSDLRYGENPHQHAAFYTNPIPKRGTIASAHQVQGKELSYNNIADADTALCCSHEFDAPCCVIVKHANPCGVAVAASIHEAYEKAYRTDPTSAFGGIIAVNRPLDELTATSIIAKQFVEVIVAPSASAAALAAIATKPNVRVLLTGTLDSQTQNEQAMLSVDGGLLLQSKDTARLMESEIKIVSKRTPNAAELADLLFAWQVAKFVKSNAIVYAKDLLTTGIGAGQMSRVVSSRIAAMKAVDAGLSVSGAVMASDAFLPFRDGLDVAAEYGITAIIQPGGSMRDDEVIAAADEHQLAMVFTGIRHFRH
jgi:phosphoribosylaminoimidazolecarboxamide formyltransferase/IMP cyclohydrolase